MFKAKDLSKVSFVFLGNSSNEARYYLDNVKITTPYKYIYVSTDGDDENDGTYENPVKTLEKAYALAKKMKTLNDKNVFVRVKSGKYDVDEEYTIGTVNEDSEHGKISFAPDNNTEISNFNRTSMHCKLVALNKDVREAGVKYKYFNEISIWYFII